MNNMVVEEILDERLVRHYSDANMMIRQIETGLEYEEAVDLIPCRYTYEETDIPIEPEEPETIADLRTVNYDE